jgi:hypothetical protein
MLYRDMKEGVGVIGVGDLNVILWRTLSLVPFLSSSFVETYFSVNLDGSSPIQKQYQPTGIAQALIHTWAEWKLKENRQGQARDLVVKTKTMRGRIKWQMVLRIEITDGAGFGRCDAWIRMMLNCLSRLLGRMEDALQVAVGTAARGTSGKKKGTDAFRPGGRGLRNQSRAKASHCTRKRNEEMIR